MTDKTITVSVEVDTTQLDELIAKLEKAKSLADEMACSKAELNIEL